jgi:hypothetical protein
VINRQQIALFGLLAAVGSLSLLQAQGLKDLESVMFC